jgi:hypothetical protein
MRTRSSARPARALAAAAAVAAIGAAAGCGPGFDPYNRLMSLRVLAIKSDPVAPAFGETTMLSAATYTPDGSTPTYEWSWCPVTPGPGVPCPFTDDQLSAMAGAPIKLQLDPTPISTFTHNIPPPVLEALCAGTSGFPAPDCTDGYPIQINLLVCTDVAGDGCTPGDAQVAAVRPMRLRFRDDPNYLNTNPTIGKLYAVIDGMDPPPELAMATLPRHKATVIGTTIDEIANSSEPYMGTDDSGKPALVSERLTLSWFVESGTTNHVRTSYIKDVTTTDATTRIKWTPAYAKDEKDSPRPDKNLARVIVIIRDDRNGVGWTDGTAMLEASP